MTAPNPVTNTDGLEDFTLPCDTRYHHPDGITGCQEPAAWTSRIRCDSCGTMHTGFLCETHKRHFHDRHGVAVCQTCRLSPMPYTCVSLERI